MFKKKTDLSISSNLTLPIISPMGKQHIELFFAFNWIEISNEPEMVW